MGMDEIVVVQDTTGLRSAFKSQGAGVRELVAWKRFTQVLGVWFFTETGGNMADYIAVPTANLLLPYIGMVSADPELLNIADSGNTPGMGQQGLSVAGAAAVSGLTSGDVVGLFNAISACDTTTYDTLMSAAGLYPKDSARWTLDSIHERLDGAWRQGITLDPLAQY